MNEVQYHRFRGQNPNPPFSPKLTWKARLQIKELGKIWIKLWFSIVCFIQSLHGGGFNCQHLAGCHQSHARRSLLLFIALQTPKNALLPLVSLGIIPRWGVVKLSQEKRDWNNHQDCFFSRKTWYAIIPKTTSEKTRIKNVEVRKQMADCYLNWQSLEHFLWWFYVNSNVELFCSTWSLFLVGF